MNKNECIIPINQTINEILPLLTKSMPNIFLKLETKTFLSILWLYNENNYPQYNEEEKIRQIIKLLDMEFDEGFVKSIDETLLNSDNKHIRETYLKHPLHYELMTKNFYESNINIYKNIVMIIKKELNNIHENDVIKYFNNKQVLNEIIMNSNDYFHLINLVEKTGLDRIVHIKEVNKARKKLKDIKEQWDKSTNIVYRFLDKDEVMCYELLLGLRLKDIGNKIS